MNNSVNGGKFIRLEHGSGGILTRELIDKVIYPHFKGENYTDLSDASAFSFSGESLITTDSYVIDPPFFPGGNIGELAVYGTCNDIAVSGGKPRFLSMGLIIEEGFPIADLSRIMESVAAAAGNAGVSIITGDTKVVPAGKGGGIFINTCGIGERLFPCSLRPENIKIGDAVIVSGPLGSHGISVMVKRESLSVGKDLKSDCASLFPLCSALFPMREKLRFLRDATRGGAAAILNEITEGMDFGIEVREDDFPVDDDVRTVSEILGLNPLEVANEGVFIAVVSASEAEGACAALQKYPEGRDARIAGYVTDGNPGRVVLETSIGGRRVLDFPRGLLLPRIC